MFHFATQKFCGSCVRYPYFALDIKIQYDLTHWDKDSTTGDEYFFLAVNHFTKVAWGKPLPDKSATTLHSAIEEMLRFLGIPDAVLSDNGSEFRNKLVEDLLHNHEIDVRHSRVRHSQTNGGSERANRTLSDKVRGPSLLTCRIS